MRPPRSSARSSPRSWPTAACPTRAARRRRRAAIVGLLLATSAADAVGARGRAAGRALVAAAGAAGLRAELVGVATGRPFGHYTYGAGLGPQVGGVPLLAAAAWAMMARPAWVVAGLITRAPRWRVLAAAGALTAWDVFLDPRMVREGYWTLAGRRALRGRPGVELPRLVRHRRRRVRGVGGVDRATTTRLRRRRRARALRVDVDRRAVRQRGALAPAARRARPAALAMGAFAVPALRARRRRASRCRPPREPRRRRRRGRRRARRRGAARCGRARGDGARGGGGARRQGGALERRRLRVRHRAVAADDAVGVRGPARRRVPELVRVEPVTRYRFADGRRSTCRADLPRALAALDAWSPGAGDDWARFLGVCAAMWRASVPFLTGPPPWPPRAARRPRADPRDPLRVRPWHTLRTLARSTVRDPRLRMVVERFATYAGADPRRAPAALAVAGYVEHAFGAWHVRGGIYGLVQALARRCVERSAGIELRRAGRPALVRAAGAAACARRRRRRRRRGRRGTATRSRSTACSARRRPGAARALAVRARRCCSACAAATRGPRAPHDPLPARLRRGVRRRLRPRGARCATRRSTSARRPSPTRARRRRATRTGSCSSTRRRARPADWEAEEERVLDRLVARGVDPAGARARASRTPGRPRARDRRGRRRDLRRRARTGGSARSAARAPRARRPRPPPRRRHRASGRRAAARRARRRARREDRRPRVSLDPPPEPPPGADLPPGDPHFRKRGGPLTTPGGQPKTGAPERRRRRERVIVMTFLWSCAAIAIAGVLIVLL